MQELVRSFGISALIRHSTFGIRPLVSLMRILSGIQPSGVLHIGNYFGMMRPAIALQAEGEALYFIADYHALTSLRDPEALRLNSRRVALDFLACGLDPERATLFRHSDVPQVTELAWNIGESGGQIKVTDQTGELVVLVGVNSARRACRSGTSSRAA